MFVHVRFTLQRTSHPLYSSSTIYTSIPNIKIKYGLNIYFYSSVYQFEFNILYSLVNIQVYDQQQNIILFTTKILQSGTAIPCLNVAFIVPTVIFKIIVHYRSYMFRFDIKFHYLFRLRKITSLAAGATRPQIV